MIEELVGKHILYFIFDDSDFVYEIDPCFFLHPVLCEADELYEIRWWTRHAITHEEVGMQRRPICPTMTISLESDSLDERACRVFFARIFEKTPTTIPFWLLIFTEVDIVDIGVIFFLFFTEIKYGINEKQMGTILEKRMTIRELHLIF
jgi:hypothetical protein